MNTNPSGTRSNGYFGLLRGNYNRPQNERRRFGQIIRNRADYTPGIAHDETDLSGTAYGIKTQLREEGPVDAGTILSSCELDEKDI